MREIVRSVVISLGVLLAAARVDAQPAPAPGDPLTTARIWVLAGNPAKAREVLQAAITAGPDGEQKDVARLFYATIPSSGRARNATPFDPGAPASNGEAVQAEQTREKFVQLVITGKRLDAVDAFKAMAKAYPNQLTPFDYYNAINAAFNAKLAKDTAAFVAEGNQKFPGDPLMQLAAALPLHWSNDAIEGVARMEKIEPTATEPLLSMVRAREVTFLSGDFDNPDRAEQAKKVAAEVMAAGQIEPSLVIQPLTSMLASSEHREGAALWLAQTAAESKDPVVAASVRTNAVKEFIRMGEVEDARKQVESWKSAGVDAKEVATLEGLVDAAAWKISGTVPPAMLTGGKGWRVTAIAPALAGPDGALVLDQSVDVAKDGSFSVPAPGASITGLVLSGESPDGKFIVKELGRGVVPSHRGGDAAYPADIVPPPAPPVAEAPVAPNEFALKYDFGIGEDFSEQLVEFTVPKPADFDPAKLVVKQDGTLAAGAPATLPAQVLEVGDKTVKVGVWRGLKQGENARLHILFDGSAPAAAMAGKVTATPDSPRHHRRHRAGPIPHRGLRRRDRSEPERLRPRREGAGQCLARLDRVERHRQADESHGHAGPDRSDSHQLHLPLRFLERGEARRHAFLRRRPALRPHRRKRHRRETGATGIGRSSPRRDSTWLFTPAVLSTSWSRW